MAPLLFQKAKGVLGDASLEKNENKPFEEMSSEERARKVKFLAKEEEDAQVEYQSWKRDYTRLVIHFRRFLRKYLVGLLILSQCEGC